MYDVLDYIFWSWNTQFSHNMAILLATPLPIKCIYHVKFRNMLNRSEFSFIWTHLNADEILNIFSHIEIFEQDINVYLNNNGKMFEFCFFCLRL